MNDSIPAARGRVVAKAILTTTARQKPGNFPQQTSKKYQEFEKELKLASLILKKQKEVAVALVELQQSSLTDRQMDVEHVMILNTYEEWMEKKKREVGITFFNKAMNLLTFMDGQEE